MKFGCPVEILMENGKSFTANLIELYSEKLGINHKLTSAFHPRTNSKVERFNGIIKPMLRKYVNGANHRWDNFWTPHFGDVVFELTILWVVVLFMSYGREPILPRDTFRLYINTVNAEDQATKDDVTSRKLEALNQNSGAAESKLKTMAQQDKEKWNSVAVPVTF